MIRLQLKRISKHFAAPGGGVVAALEDLSLDLAAGDFVVVVGPNASGKSTLLNLIAGREQPDTGTITATVAGEDEDWTLAQLRHRGRQIARIHQDPTAGTADELSVVEHLRLAELVGVPGIFLNSVPARERSRLWDRLGATSLKTKPEALVGELSQGQRQLLALEMAAARSVAILLLDEPTASLDRTNAAFCMRRTQELHGCLGVTILLVTHDMAIAAECGNRLIVLRDGRLTADVSGPEKAALRPEDVFHLCGFDSPAMTKASDIGESRACSV